MIQSKATLGDDPRSLDSIGQFEVRSSIDGLHCKAISLFCRFNLTLSSFPSYLSQKRDTDRKRSSKLASWALISYYKANFHSQIVFNDLTVSNKHVKIYSISYDQSNCSNIKPLIYAEDLSSNGTYWNGSLVGKTNGAVLLSDGDVLRISPRISLLFRTEMDCEMNEPSSFQESEMKVRLSIST